MDDTTKIEIHRKNEGLIYEELITTPDVPQVEIGEATGVGDFSKLNIKPANVCIYCNSKEILSKEHILAYGLGGIPSIPKGSCEVCRKITHNFETAVLRGPMQMVRYIQDIQSRTKHKDVPKTIPVKITVNGREIIINAPRDEAPIMLPFPLFETPGYLDSNKCELNLSGIVTGNFGADPEQFARKHGAQKIEIPINNNYTVAFAQLIAKTAYANAYAQGQLKRLKNAEELVKAMMKEPNTIGRFVGTVPDRYVKYPMLHRISNRVEHRVMYSLVQLFANIGAPTYIVILGTLKDDEK